MIGFGKHLKKFIYCCQLYDGSCYYILHNFKFRKSSDFDFFTGKIKQRIVYKSLMQYKVDFIKKNKVLILNKNKFYFF